MSSVHSINADSVVEIKVNRGSDKDSEEAIKKLGPDSIMWRDFGTYLYQLILPQAFVLQSAHPMVDRAVSVDKKYKLNPWGRARDSLKLLWPVIYSKPKDAIDMGVRLRELHRSIKGTNEAGQKYHALDPEAYAWVHMTGYDALLRLYRFFSNHKLTGKEKAALFEEWKAMGTMLGIVDKTLPQTEEEYWQRYNYILNERLIKGPVLDDLLDPLYVFKYYPKPPNSNMPNAVWKGVALLLGLTQYNIILATLPEPFRDRIGLKYGLVNKLFFNSFAFMVKTFFPMLPEKRQYMGLVWRIMEDAKAHPEEYRLPS
ncbi:MAG TPA: oxygenase MpaB family protein [Pseudomonadales bacterium]|nr:oxygenase MpaB family protein [Pseudomonadales bacterium]